MEVRHAVRQLYVMSSAPGSSAEREWHRALDGGLRKEPAAQDSLPGPCGGHALHLHPKPAQQGAPDQPHLPKASTASPLHALAARSMWPRLESNMAAFLLHPGTSVWVGSYAEIIDACLDGAALHAGVGGAGGVGAAAGCQRHAAQEGAGQAGVLPAQDRGGSCTSAGQPHPSPAKHAGG